MSLCVRNSQCGFHAIIKSLKALRQTIRLRFPGFSLRQVCVYDMSLRRPYGKRRLQAS